MTQETLTAPSEPLEARILNAVYLLLGVVFFGFLIWQQLDPDGPRDWLDKLRERAHERRLFAQAIGETLADIDGLPETEYSSGMAAADRMQGELDDELDDVDGFGSDRAF